MSHEINENILKTSLNEYGTPSKIFSCTLGTSSKFPGKSLKNIYDLNMRYVHPWIILRYTEHWRHAKESHISHSPETPLKHSWNTPETPHEAALKILETLIRDS